jgi:hypothetical protein
VLLKSKRNEMSHFNQINLHYYNTNYIKEHNSIWQQFGGFYFPQNLLGALAEICKRDPIVLQEYQWKAEENKTDFINTSWRAR